ncbi:MAG: hypothetical protein ACRDRW_04640 [Pseudonocardiaceae bacterium]
MSGEDGARPGPLPGMPGAQATPAPAAGSSGQPVLPQPTTTTGSGGFSVDLERAPHAIAELRVAAEALRDEARRAQDLANIWPPGFDDVSEDAVHIMSDAAVGKQGSVRLALLGAAARFENDADKLEASLKTYRRVDRISIPIARELNFGTQR